MTRGGKRPGAGAPKGNMNGLRILRHSPRALLALAALQSVEGEARRTVAFAFRDAGFLSHKGEFNGDIRGAIEFAYRYFFDRNRLDSNQVQSSPIKERSEDLLQVSNSDSDAIKAAPENATRAEIAKFKPQSNTPPPSAIIHRPSSAAPGRRPPPPASHSATGRYTHIVNHARIAGTGHYLPERILTNAELEKLVQTSDQWIRDRTGIQERHIAAPEETSSSLGYHAARMALDDARINPEDIDLIIAGTSTPDGLFPSVASLVQARLGAVNAGAFDVSAACMGFLSAFSAATQFIATGAYLRVLVLGAEVPSRILNWQDRSTCVLFGDGAGAVLLEAAEFGGPLGFALHSDGSKKSALFADGPCGARDADGNGPAPHLCMINMDGPAMFKMAVHSMTGALREALAKAHLTVADVDLLIPHQANLRIIQGTAKALGMPMDKAYLTVHKYGNTFAATIPIALSEAYREGRLHEGDKLAMCSIGGGLAWGGMVFEYSRTGKAPVSQTRQQLAVGG